MEKAKIEDIKKYAEKITYSGSLCNFTGKCESETMVGQTIHAAVNNFNEHGEAFSIKDIKLVGDNFSAYRWLLDEQYFIEEDREEQIFIFPTQRLMDKLFGYFA